MKQEFKFELGDTLQCKVTGFKGTCTACIVYINGCLQYCLKPPVDKDGKLVEGEFFDEAQIDLVKTEAPVVEKKKTGGPQMDQPKA